MAGIRAIALGGLRIALAGSVLGGAFPSAAAEVHVAVAANFSEAADEIATAFEAATEHSVILSFGSTGQLYAQITQAAPFDVFLAADEARPAQLIEDGLAVAQSRFTYALGQLVLWSADDGRVVGAETLAKGAFARLAIADPAVAPYGAASIQTLAALGLEQALNPKLVRGNSIAQTFQFVATGNAELGFVAWAQLIGNESGSRWVVPQKLYEPIVQDAVLLEAGRDNDGAFAFLDFLKRDARPIIKRFGYGLAED